MQMTDCFERFFSIYRYCWCYCCCYH